MEQTMSDHGIEELRRQHAKAESRLENAEKAVREATRRLSKAAIDKANADFAARGITPGTVVLSKSNWKYLNGNRGIFVGHETWDCLPWAAEPVVMKIKKDGTASQHRQRGENWQKAEGAVDE